MNKDQLAFLGGAPIGKIQRPSYPVFEKHAVDAATEQLLNGSTVGLGKSNRYIDEAEQSIENYHGQEYKALLLNSGQSALSAALIGLGIGAGDKVITTPYTWGATISSILAIGAIPVFADIDPLTGLICPTAVESRLDSSIRAILVVHIYGQPADMVAFQKLSRKYNIPLIEDGSQAHGARIHGTPVGNFSDASGFSCMGGKLLATAEAGYMLTNNDDLFWNAAISCQHYGRSAEDHFPEQKKAYVDSIVLTYRLSPVIASLLPSQLKKLDSENNARRENYKRFRQSLGNHSCLNFPEPKEGVLPSYHILTMNFSPEAAGIQKKTFMEALKAEGLECLAYVPKPINLWKRLHWKNYQGPKPFWFNTLKNHQTEYENERYPKCEYKSAHSFEINVNAFYYYNPEAMDKMAEIFLKVLNNLEALKAWEKKHDQSQEFSSESATISAAKSAVKSYSNTAT